MLAAAVVGLGFALYLTYVEGYVLETWCILCLSSLGLIAAISNAGGSGEGRDRDRGVLISWFRGCRVAPPERGIEALREAKLF